MGGNPWLGYGSEHIPARRLIVEVIKVMAVNGWNLVQAADVSKKEQDKDSLFFETVDPTMVSGADTQEVDLFCISFSSGDKLRVIDNSNPDVVAVIRQAIKSQWKAG